VNTDEVDGKGEEEEEEGVGKGKGEFLCLQRVCRALFQ
jgi:hypothetical protein